MQDTGCRILDAGYWMQDTGCRILDAGYRILDTGCRILDAGYWMQTLDSISSLKDIID